MGWLIFFGCVIDLIIMGFIASEFRHIAAKKGFDERKYFWWTFLLSFIGMLMVIALPDHGVNKTVVPVNTQLEDDELPDL